MTRFYFPFTGTAPVSPAFDSEWDDTSLAIRRPLNREKGTTAFNEIAYSETSAVATYDALCGQFVSPPLRAQTLSGSFTSVIRAREGATAANARSQMVVKVVSNDGTTVKATLVAPDPATSVTNEWVATATATAARNQYFPVGTGPKTFTSYTCIDGDRLVIEIGGRFCNTTTTAQTLAVRFGENATDLVSNQTGTTEGAPWIDFANDILLEGDPDPPPKAIFQKGVDNYTGTVDTYIRSSSPTTSRATDAEIHFDNDLISQGLLRFDNIFGSGTGQIPTGSTIVSAKLTLNCHDAGSGTVDFHRILVPWTDADTWATFNNNSSAGITLDGIVAVAAPDLSSSQTTLGTWDFDITTTVQAWAGGAPNYGWGILAGSTSGMAFGSSESAFPPILTIVYTPPSTGKTGAVTSSFKALTAAAAAARTAPTKTGAVASTFGPLSATAVASRTIPTRTGTAASSFAGLTSSAAAARTIPTRTSSTAVSLSPLTASATAQRTIPTRTGAVTSSLAGLSSAASAARVIPDRAAAVTASFKPLAAASTASGAYPDRAGAVASSFGRLSAASTASRIPAPLSASVAASLGRMDANAAAFRSAPGEVTSAIAASFKGLTATATAARTIPTRTAAAVASFGKVSAEAQAVRIPPAKTATAAASFGKLSASATAARTQPGAVSGAVASSFKSLTATAIAARTIPDRTGNTAASFKRMTAAVAAYRIPPPVAGDVNSSFKVLRATADAIRIPPPVSSDVAASFGALSADGSAVRFYPGTIGAVASSFPPLSSDAIAVRDYPTFGGDIASSFKRMTASAAAKAQIDYSAATFLGAVYVSGIIDADIHVIGMIEI